MREEQAGGARIAALASNSHPRSFEPRTNLRGAASFTIFVKGAQGDSQPSTLDSQLFNPPPPPSGSPAQISRCRLLPVAGKSRSRLLLAPADCPINALTIFECVGSTPGSSVSLFQGRFRASDQICPQGQFYSPSQSVSMFAAERIARFLDGSRTLFENLTSSQAVSAKDLVQSARMPERGSPNLQFSISGPRFHHF